MDLDALCDLLEDDPDFEEQEESNVADGIPEASNELVSDVTTEGDDVTEMEKQLKQMQEQMMKMQQMLAKKKSQKGSSQSATSPPASCSSQAASTVTSPAASTAASATAVVSPTVGVKPKGPLREVNLFNVPETSAQREKGPRSPVKTNPFESYDKPVRLAKLNAETPKYGPALPKKVTRVLSGEERAKFEKSLKEREEGKLMKQVSQDLDLSSDEDIEKRDDDSNLCGSRYNNYGQDVARVLAAGPTRHHIETEKPKTPSFTQELGKKPVGFNSVQGSTLNLSKSNDNRLLPNALWLEKHSRIRISSPETNQVAFDLSLIGRKFIPIQRIKSAISIKETECDWATVGIVYYKTSLTSKNGNNYTLLKLTDLLGDIETCALYLFGRASAKLYSVPLNRVIGILNPKVMDNRNGSGGSSKNEVSLSIDHPDKVMEMGDSLDISRCQAKKNDGSGCTNLVNKASCEYCTYHVKKAYKSISSKRGDLQSAFSGNGEVRARIMAKVAPKGEVFAGGQILNTGLVGRQCAKQTQKDRNVLNGLGVVTCPAPSNTITGRKVDRLLSDTPGSRLLNDAAFFQPGNGKLTFRSHLNETERAAVKKIASGVSEELGLKLLNPTAGARLLMKHLTKDDPLSKDFTEDLSGLTKKEIDAKMSCQKQQEAQKLLKEQKIIHKSSQVPTVSLKSPPTPRLGRGLSGGFVDLSSPSPSAVSKAVDPQKLKAILALKGKSLAKTDPNNVLKRKRTSEDLENFQKKVISKLEGSEPSDLAAVASLEDLDEADQRFVMAKKKAKGERPKEIRSLTGEIIDEKRMAELRKIKSKNHNLAEEAELEAEDKYFDKLEKKEAMEEKMMATREIESTVISCKICNYTAMSQSELCRDSNHPVKKMKAVKKFFECQKCKKRTFSFDRYPKRACANCGESSWARTSMMRERKGPLLDSEKLLVRGVEQKFINASVSSASLNLEL